jgi:hypothetical protein
LALEEGNSLGRKLGWGRVREETRVVERVVVIVVDDNCMAPGNLKMDIPESPMREEGDTPSSTEESEVESKNPLLTLGRKTSSAAAHTSSVHELLECPVCTNSMYPPIHQVPNLLFSLCVFFWGGLFFPLSLSLCSACSAGFVEEEEEHHCSSSSHPPHPLAHFCFPTTTATFMSLGKSEMGRRAGDVERNH